MDTKTKKKLLDVVADSSGFRVDADEVGYRIVDSDGTTELASMDEVLEHSLDREICADCDSDRLEPVQNTDGDWAIQCNECGALDDARPHDADLAACVAVAKKIGDQGHSYTDREEAIRGTLIRCGWAEGSHGRVTLTLAGWAATAAALATDDLVSQALDNIADSEEPRDGNPAGIVFDRWVR